MSVIVRVLPDGAIQITEAPAAVQDDQEPKEDKVRLARRAALRAVLDALDGWIEGAKSNHGALEHRGEPRGEECWNQFAAEDIRQMVNDAARELGVREFGKTP